MTFRPGQPHRLSDPCRYDDEFGTGYGYAIPVEGTEGCLIADCWIVDASGNRHPGYDESPVPIRFQDLVPVGAVEIMREIAAGR